MLDENNHLLYAQPIPRNPGHFLTIADMAVTIAEPGEDKAKVHASLRQFASQGYLYAPARETLGRQAYLYSPTSCIVAAVLLRLTEIGIRDANASRVAANALYWWKPEDGAPQFSPGQMVIRNYVEGDRDWTLELWTLRHDGGQVVHDARLYKPAAGRGLDLHHDLSKFALRAVVAIDLADVLDRMHSQGMVN